MGGTSRRGIGLEREEIMATRFVRIDLSDGARDFRPLAIEPGLAMLDKGGANARILFRWIGGMAAEPVWEGRIASTSMSATTEGGRLEEVLCQPADELELRGSLKDEIARLRERIQHARAETPSERSFHKLVLRTLADLLDNPDRTDLDNYFFRYRDVDKPLAAGVVLGLSAGRSGVGPGGDLHRSGLRVAVCAEAESEVPSAPPARRRCRFARQSEKNRDGASSSRCCCCCFGGAYGLDDRRPRA